MASHSWTVDLPEGRHRIDVDYGYWSGKATVRVDDRTVSAGRPLLKMSFDRGLDIPVNIDGHALVVSIRPILRGSFIVTDYRFGLSIEDTPVAGTDPLPRLRSVYSGLRSVYSGPRFVEAMAWASAGGGVIGLSRHGENPTAILFLAAPLACSLVTRQTRLPTRLMALVCLGIIIAGIVVVAAIGAAIRR